mgnify:FL=1
MNEKEIKEMILVAQSLIENYNDFFKNKNKKIPENIKNTYLNLASSFLKDNESVKSDELQKLCKTIQENLNEAENRISTHNQNIANNDNQNEIIYTNKFSNKIEIIKNKVTELLEKNIKKQDILIIPYTNKTVKLLNSEINNENEININTINNLVLEIINKSSNENLKIENTNIENLIKEKLNKLLEDDIYLANLCKYLIHYHFRRKNELEFTDNEELNKYYIQNERLTLKGELVNNFDEVDIANFLYENQIEYTYQENIFNLINSGIVIKYSKEDNQNAETNTIICYAKEKLEGKLLTNLYNHLQTHNVQFNPMPAKDLWTNLKKQNQNILEAIVELFQTIIMQLTTSNQNLENFNTSLQNKKLIELVSPIYNDYLSSIKENDINNLIKKATDLIKTKEYNQNYKYIIVEDAMNLTTNNYNFINELINSTKASCIFLGRVEECIYEINGSNPKYLINESFKKTHLETNADINQKIINLLDKFINTKSHINGTLNDPNALDLIYNLDEKLDTLPQNSKILLIGRYNEDINLLNNNYKINNQNITYINREDLNIKFVLARRCKEEQADYTIILNNSNSLSGFPNKLLEAPILNQIMNNTLDLEKLLYYNACLTSSKGLFLYLTGQANSSFVEELKDIYLNKDTKN